MDDSPITSLVLHRRLVWSMTRRDFRSKYAGSLMGVFWTVINPLLLLAIFTFLFSVVFKARFSAEAGLGANALYILAGILPWLGLQEGIARSATVVLENKNLVTRARFPLPALPAYPALSALLGQLAGMALLVIIASAADRRPGLSLLILPLILILQLVFALGLALFISALAVRLRDLVHIIPVLILVWMYATPIFYPAAMVPPKFQLVIALNPMAHFITAYRQILLEAAWPGLHALLFLAASALLSLLAGAAVFKRLSKGFADAL